MQRSSPEIALELMPDALRRMVQDEPTSGERIEWVGMPIAWRYALLYLPQAAIAVPFTGFSVFWIYNVLRIQNVANGINPSMFFVLFGLPFLLVGLAGLCSPLWGVHKARNSAYLLTNRRAIVVSGGWSFTVRSFGWHQLDRMRRRQNGDGSGDLMFDETPIGPMNHQPLPSQRRVGFLAIPHVKSVEELIRHLADSTLAEQAGQEASGKGASF